MEAKDRLALAVVTSALGVIGLTAIVCSTILLLNGKTVEGLGAGLATNVIVGLVAWLAPSPVKAGD